LKTLFFSIRDYEEPFLKIVSDKHEGSQFIKEALSIDTAIAAKGFEAISIFVGDDASDIVLQKLAEVGVKHIAIRAVGYDNIDLRKAKSLNITVANVPDYSPYAIAEHAVTLMLALNRKIVLGSQQVFRRNFTINNLVGFDLHNKTVGIIGVGKIGAVLVKIMHGFGCNLLGYDIKKNELLEKEYGLKYVDLETLCNSSNIISIHTSLTPETKYLINKRLIDMMLPNAMIINTSRGGCVNTIDLIEGLNNNRIGSYGADVYEKEKGIFFYDYTYKELKDDILKKLLAMQNVLITPHQAFATKEALKNIADTTAYNIECWSKNERSKNELIIQ
jgi:D-lactate dehydrogenase